MVKTPMVKLRKNHKTQLLFATLFFMIIFAQIFIIVPSKLPVVANMYNIDQKFEFFAYAIGSLSILLAISFLLASFKDPGRLKPEFPFMELLRKVHPCEMCPDCRVIRTSRSKHCAICNMCVERFDHHCPWINNCVGIGNHNAFIVFITTLLLILLLIVASSVFTLIDECHPN